VWVDVLKEVAYGLNWDISVALMLEALNLVEISDSQFLLDHFPCTRPAKPMFARKFHGHGVPGRGPFGWLNFIFVADAAQD
jgi:hypothetical protein